MINFCPHCGAGINQNQKVGEKIKCLQCGLNLGTVEETNLDKVGFGVSVFSVDEALDKVKALPPEVKTPSNAATCPLCGQLVQFKPNRTFVPHYAKGEKKICKNSGKPAK
ncbi:MAG: hypothetical protein AB7K24_18540 [Gemmataceae bacterium]